MVRKTNYQNGLIYKLCCNDLNVKEIYVGSTCNFRSRKSGHKSTCHNEKSKSYNLNVYKYIRAHGGFQNWSQILIENYPCDSKQKLVARERYWKEQLNANLNTLVPGRTLKEYYELHKKEISEYHRQYREENKEKLLKQNKQRYEDNKQIYSIKAKQYREKNKEKISNKSKKKYELNKEKILEHKKRKTVCECGREVRKEDISRHKRSKIHNKIMKDKQLN